MVGQQVANCLFVNPLANITTFNINILNKGRYNMYNFIDMTGWIMSEHGVPKSKLTVVERVEDRVHPNGKCSVMWKCLCDCGDTIVADGCQIRSGHTVSCGHHKKEKSPSMTHVDFLGKIYALRDDVEIIGEYEGFYNKVKYRCKICGEISEASPKQLYRCNSCLNCKRINRRMTNGEFLHRMSELHPTINILSEYETQNTHILCQCKICQHIWNPVARSLLCKEGCPHCHKSKGETKIEQFLKDNLINFEPQKTYSGLVGVGNGLLSYDFYLPDFNLLVEYQGQFHDGTAPRQSTEELIVQVEHDRRKREYASHHNIGLLEIWYYDFNNIENILQQHTTK